MKILFCNSEAERESYIEQVFAGHQVEFFEGLALESTVGLDCEVLSIFVASKLTRETLMRFPNLKFIATRSTGFDHIDLVACKERGIQVASVPAYGERTVAEYAFALLLALSRRVYDGVYRVKHLGEFSSENLTGFDLFGKTLGIVGTGKIGYHVAVIAKGFGMDVVASDLKENPELVSNYQVKYLPLEELLAQSDVITLHAPYLPATHHLLNSENISKIKKGAVLINTARGALVETVALVEALSSGQLAGAALDVLEEEGFVSEEMEIIESPHPKAEQLRTVLADHQLMGLKNVLVTPHNAFNTQEALDRIWQTTLDNIQAYQNHTPQNLVNLI
jgi:D-lactate dehydrogenase